MTIKLPLQRYEIYSNYFGVVGEFDTPASENDGGDWVATTKVAELEAAYAAIEAENQQRRDMIAAMQSRLKEASAERVQAYEVMKDYQEVRAERDELRAILSDVKAWDISHAVEPPPMQPTLFTLPQELRAKIQKAIE